jgi:hypothetical protein
MEYRRIISEGVMNHIQSASGEVKKKKEKRNTSFIKLLCMGDRAPKSQEPRYGILEGNHARDP